AARQRTGLLGAALLEAREIAIDPVDVVSDRAAAAACHRADLEILLDGLAGKSAAALRHMRDAEPHDVFGGAAVDRLVVEANAPLRAAHAGERAQRRGLAGAVRAEQRRDAAFVDAERKPEQHLRGAVEGAELACLQELRHLESFISLSPDRRGSRRR